MAQQKPSQEIKEVQEVVKQEPKKVVKKVKKRKHSSDEEPVVLKERTDQKVELNLFKNYTKTKKTLIIRQNLTFEAFKKKINPSFTSKYFMIQIEWRKKGKYLSIDNEEQFDLVMKQYKGQKINIKTLDQPYIEPARRKEVEEAKRKKKIQDTKKGFQDQLNASISKNMVEFQRIFPHVGPQKIQKCFRQMVANAQKWMRNQLIYKYHPLKQKQKKLNLQKSCSQCRSRFYGPYYICLKCPQQYILCHQCQFKYCYQQLKTHPNINHTFAKIVDHKYTIKSAQITTLPEEEIQKDFYPTFMHKTNNYEFIEERMLEQKAFQVDRKKLKVDHNFKKEHEPKFKEDFAYNLVSSLQRINFTGYQQEEVIPSIPVRELIKGYQKFTSKTLQELQTSKPYNPQVLRTHYYKQMNIFNRLLSQNKLVRQFQLAITDQPLNPPPPTPQIKAEPQNKPQEIKQNDESKQIKEEQNQIVKKQQTVAVPVMSMQDKISAIINKKRKDEWQQIQRRKKQKQGENYVRPQQIYLKDLVPIQQKQLPAISRKQKEKKYEKLKKLDIPIEVLESYMVDKYQNYTYLQILDEIKKINEKRQIQRKYRVYENRQRRMFYRQRQSMVSSSSQEQKSDPEEDARLLQEVKEQEKKEREQRIKKREKQKAERDGKIRLIKQI